MEVIEGKLTISPQYFRNAVKKTYSSPFGQILAREFVQNGVDAGSTVIKFNFDLNNNTLTVENDGRIITRSELLDKLLSIGGTTKECPGTIGGFGVAKDILYFCHDRYKIESGAFLVEGQSDNYTFFNNPENLFSGFRSTIWLNKDEMEFIKSEVINYIMDCELSTYIYVDNLLASQAVKRKDLLWQNDFGSLHHTPFSDAHMYNGRFYIRVKGVKMFHTWINSEAGCCVFEINSEKANEILTSCRENFRGSYYYTLQDIIQNLIINPRSATKKNIVSIHLHKGNGYLNTCPTTFLPTYLRISGEEGVKLDTSDMEVYAQRHCNGTLQVSEVMEGAQLQNYPHFIVLEDKASGYDTQSSSPPSWNHDTQVIAKLWELIIKQVLISRGWHGLYGIGFVFESGTGASLCTYKKTEWFLFNPFVRSEHLVIGNGLIDELLDRAIHEVAHLISRNHDETFVGELEHLRRLTRKDKQEYAKLLREVVVENDEQRCYSE